MKKESIMNRKHFYIIAGIFILALAGCSIKKEDTKKIQDIEFTVVATEDVPEVWGSEWNITRARRRCDCGSAHFLSRSILRRRQKRLLSRFRRKRKNGVQCRGQRMLRNIRCYQDPDNTSRSGKGREDKRKEDISVCGDENRI